MSRVSVRTDKTLGLVLDAKFTAGTRRGQSTTLKNYELKVFRCEESNIIFTGLGPNHHVAFSINGADFVTYYYQGKDDEGFIFYSTP